MGFIVSSTLARTTADNTEHLAKFQYVELFDPKDIGMIVLNPRRKNEPPCA